MRKGEKTLDEPGRTWYYNTCADQGDHTKCASGGIGRLAGFRCQCSQGRAGSTPASRTNLIRIRFSYENGFGSFCFFRHPKTTKQGGALVLPPFSLSVLRPRLQRAIEIAGRSAAIHQEGGAGDEPAPVAHEQLRHIGHLVCRCSCGDTLPKGRPDNGPEIMELFEHSGHLVCPIVPHRAFHFHAAAFRFCAEIRWRWWKSTEIRPRSPHHPYFWTGSRV